MPENILLISYCKIGDSLIMLPALRELRRQFRAANISLISEYYLSKDAIGAQTLLEHAGLIDNFYKIYTSRSRLVAPWLMRITRAVLCSRLRKTKWDLAAVMMPPYPPMTAAFATVLKNTLASCGADNILPFEAVSLEQVLESGSALKSADWLVQNLSGVCDDLPGIDEGDCSLPEYPDFAEKAAEFMRAHELEGKRCIALAPSAHIPCNVWKAESYITVLRRLEQEHDLKVMVFGGAGDRELIKHICSEVEICVPVIGEDIRLAAELISCCSLYLGCDTGLMHMAAAKSVRCVGVFSCRNPRVIWEPYGKGHRVLRGDVECVGCVSYQCPHGYPPCLKQVGVDEVTAACLDLLRD